MLSIMREITEADAAPWMPAAEEYFAAYADGVWDEASQLQTILPRGRIYIVPERGELVVGHAGVDGIHFCFRQGLPGIFAWYGIDGEHRLLAPDLRSLLAGWQDGSITV